MEVCMHAGREGWMDGWRYMLVYRMCVCVYARMCVYVCMCVCVYACMHAWMDVWICMDGGITGWLAGWVGRDVWIDATHVKQM